MICVVIRTFSSLYLSSRAYKNAWCPPLKRPCKFPVLPTQRHPLLLCRITQVGNHEAIADKDSTGWGAGIGLALRWLSRGLRFPKKGAIHRLDKSVPFFYAKCMPGGL